MSWYQEEIEAKRLWLLKRNTATVEAYDRYVSSGKSDICIIQLLDKRMHNEAEEAERFSFYLTKKGA